MRRLLSVILVIFFIFPAFCGVFAEKEMEFSSAAEKVEMPTGGLFPCKKVPIDESNIVSMPKSRSSQSQTSENVYEFVESQLRKKSAYIRLYPAYTIGVNIFYDEKTGMPCDADLSNLWDVLCTILFNNYDILAYVGCTNFYYTKDDGGNCYIVGFIPSYINPTEGDQAAISMMNEEIDKYIDAASEIPDSDVVGKMLVIHDLFCEKNTYAYEELKAKSDKNIYTAYGLFKNNRAVCQGNAIALKAIYDKLNGQLTEEHKIKTGLCSSDNLNHIWNVVKIDGKWYHIDETWDDPVFLVQTGAPGEEEYDVFVKKYAIHRYFLKSYDAMADHIKKGIYDWVYYADGEVLCDSKKYESGYIFNFMPEKYYVYNEETGGRIENIVGQLIAYEDGRYRLETERLGGEYLFWAESIRATKALATDVYENGNGENEILLFVRNNTDACKISAMYNANGMLTECSKGDESLRGGTFNQILAESSYSHMFIWSRENFEPLCRVIDIP